MSDASTPDATNSPAQRTESDASAQPTVYDLIGGADGLRRLVDRFYDVMDSAPEAAGIRAMHGADLAPMRKRLFEFFSGWFGGPRLYAGCVMSAHRPFVIGVAERDAWMFCMRRAMADCAVDETIRPLLDQALSRMAEAFRNR